MPTTAGFGIEKTRTRGPRADDGDRHAAAVLGDARGDPALLPGALHDGVLDVLDRHGLVHQARHAAGSLRGKGGLVDVIWKDGRQAWHAIIIKRMYAQNAPALAGGRADEAGELGEVVGLV